MTRRRENKQRTRDINRLCRYITRKLGQHDWASQELQLQYRAPEREYLRQHRKLRRSKPLPMTVQYGWRGNLICETPGVSVRITQ